MPYDVASAAYTVELTHNPADGSAVCWTARVYQPDLQDGPVYTTFGKSREHAFDFAQTWVKASLQPADSPSTVALDANGEIIDTAGGER